jgi:hypothetical protein
MVKPCADARAAVMRDVMQLSRIFVLATCALVSTSVHPAEPAPGRVAAIKAELLQMVKSDQEVRERYSALLREEPLNPSKPSPRFLSMVKEMGGIDADNDAQLEKIIAEIGWPAPALVGEDASRGAWIILQHADLSIQEKFFPLIKKEAAAGHVRPADAAMLEDRILQREGKPQKYGTQIVTAPDGRWVLYTLEDPADLVARRAGVGLPPMDVYLRKIEQEIGQHVDRSALDPAKKQQDYPESNHAKVH